MSFELLPTEIANLVLDYPLSTYFSQQPVLSDKDLAIRSVSKAWYLKTENLFASYLKAFEQNPRIHRFLASHNIQVHTQTEEAINKKWKKEAKQDPSPNGVTKVYPSNFHQVISIYYKVLKEVALISKSIEILSK